MAVTSIAVLAAVTDNLVPTGTYSPTCSKGGNAYGHACKTDNSTWTFYRQSSPESADKSIVWNGMWDEYNPTHLAVVHQSSPSYSGGSETDAIFQEDTVTGGNVGYTWCDDPISGNKCDQHYIRIEAAYFNYGYVCHEAGHGVGLVHGANADPVLSNTHSALACMRNPPSSSAGLGTNNRDNIDSNY